MHLKLNRPTIEIETQERAFIDVFFKILFVEWGKQKKRNLLAAKKINLRLVNFKLNILTYKKKTAISSI